MAANTQQLKGRIKSINATKKITSAMELIANVKLKKQRNLMERNREYATILKDTVSKIMTENQGTVDNQFLQEKTSPHKLTFLMTSDMGLCGGYNTNMMKLAEQVLNPADPMLVIGTHQRAWLRERGFNILNESQSSDNISFQDLKSYVDDAILMYQKDQISGIQVLYTQFVNTVTFTPRMETLLPCLPTEFKEKDQQLQVETLFEPNPNEILDYLIPMMIENVTYSLWMQTKTAEQGSRRFAMESATDNATELNDKLILEFNQARQASITQEITEIVSGADAL